MTVVSDSLEKHSVIQIAVLKSNMTTMIRLPRLRPRDFDHWLTPFESMTVMATGPLMERVVSQGEILRIYRLLDLSSIKGFLDQKIVTSTNSPGCWWRLTLEPVSLVWCGGVERRMGMRVGWFPRNQMKKGREPSLNY